MTRPGCVFRVLDRSSGVRPSRLICGVKPDPELCPFRLRLGGPWAWTAGLTLLWVAGHLVRGNDAWLALDRGDWFSLGLLGLMWILGLSGYIRWLVCLKRYPLRPGTVGDSGSPPT